MDIDFNEDGTILPSTSLSTEEEGDIIQLYNTLLAGQAVKLLFASRKDLKSFRNSFASAKIRYDQQNIDLELMTRDDVNTLSISSSVKEDGMIEALLLFTPKGTRLKKRVLHYTVVSVSLPLTEEKEQE
jgi:hypothetical protein